MLKIAVFLPADTLMCSASIYAAENMGNSQKVALQDFFSPWKWSVCWIWARWALRLPPSHTPLLLRIHPISYWWALQQFKLHVFFKHLTSKESNHTLCSNPASVEKCLLQEEKKKRKKEKSGRRHLSKLRFSVSHRSLELAYMLVGAGRMTETRKRLTLTSSAPSASIPGM